MNLRQIKGNTWVLEGSEWIPLYMLDDRRCILLDTGLGQEQEDLENTLLEHQLTPAGILCSTPTWTTEATTAISRKSTTPPWPSPPRRRACAPGC